MQFLHKISKICLQLLEHLKYNTSKSYRRSQKLTSVMSQLVAYKLTFYEIEIHCLNMTSRSLYKIDKRYTVP